MFFAELGCGLVAIVCLTILTSSMTGAVRRGIGYVLPVAMAALLAASASSLEPWERLLATTLGLLYTIKLVILTRRAKNEIDQPSQLGLAVYMSIWPGMNPAPLAARVVCDEDGKRFARGMRFALMGLIGSVALAWFQPQLGAQLTGWLGIAVLLMIIHFGWADMLTTLMRLCGWNVGPLFEEPLKSTSLREFWGKRWNLAFVEMNKILFLDQLKSRFGITAAVFGVFLISGLLHDACISYSAGGGWGLPTTYFILQGLVVLLERKLLPATSPLFVRVLWTWLWLFVPMSLLFTEQFRSTFIVPLFQYLHVLLTQHDARWYLSLSLWGAALGNFCTMGAGLQAPFRLNWFEELSRISEFNKKIFLNYAFYVGLMIVSFGLFTVILHDEILHGDKAALCLCALMSVFWGLRIVVDYFYFGDDGWPQGAQFVMGHACLNALFTFLTLTYTSALLWHLLGHTPF